MNQTRDRTLSRNDRKRLDALQRTFHDAAWAYARALGAYCQEPVHVQGLHERHVDTGKIWNEARIAYVTACDDAGVAPAHLPVNEESGHGR